MQTSRFYWQPIAAVPFFFRLNGDLSELLPFLCPVFGSQQVTEAEVERALNDENARTFEWRIERDETENLWRAIPVEGKTLEAEVTESSSPTAFVTQIEYGAVLRLFYHLDKRFFGLHSAFLSKNGHGVIIIGPKEAGKSTLSCGLWQHGWRLHADDLTVLDEQFQPHPNPRRVSLRYPSRELLGEELWQRIQGAPSLFSGSLNVLFHPSDLG